MNPPAWLTRVSLSRSASARALVQLLVPGKADLRAESSHKLLWTLFGDTEDRKRDFLWREEGQGRFTLLSARPPQDYHNLFDPFEAKPFDPAVAAGDRLHFLLRANATVRHRGDPKRRDVVMDAIHTLPSSDRAEARRTAEQDASRKWLNAQGIANGFAVTGMACLGYETVSIPRERDEDGGVDKDAGAGMRRRADPVRLGIVELEGDLTVMDPALFAAKLLSGFGRARAFGFGLMLVARPG